MKTKPAARKRPAKTAARKRVVVTITADSAEFRREGEEAPYSRLAYGPFGSDARERVTVEIELLREWEGVEVEVIRK